MHRNFSTSLLLMIVRKIPLKIALIYMDFFIPKLFKKKKKKNLVSLFGAPVIEIRCLTLKEERGAAFTTYKVFIWII